MVDSSFRIARFTVKAPWRDTLEYVPLLRDIETRFHDTLGPGVTVTTTGIMSLFSRTLNAAMRSAAKSYVIAFGAITLMMILLIGNFKLGLAAMLPNLAPIAVVMGLMWWVGIPLNMFTMLVGSIAIGLAVDDTVHFMHNFRRYYAQTGDVRAAVHQTLHTAGRAMLVTSVVLAVGFYIFMFASMNNVIQFGLLTGTAILLALLSDFLLAPALMVLLNPAAARYIHQGGQPMNRMRLAFYALSRRRYGIFRSRRGGGELTAREIMEKVDARDDGDNSTATLEMTLIDKRGGKRVRQVTVFTKDKGRGHAAHPVLPGPRRRRGTGFLTYDYYSGEKDDDQWLYLPELRKTKRIASSDKSGSFMGTDFSYADMTRRVLDEWTYKLLKEDEVRGEKVWLVEATARATRLSATVTVTTNPSSSCARTSSWWCAPCTGSATAARLKYFDMKRLEQIDGIWMGTELDMKTTKGGETLHRTVMRFSNVKFNQKLDEGMFTVRRLEKGP